MPDSAARNFIEFIQANANQPGWTVGEIVTVPTADNNPDSWQFAAVHEDSTMVICSVYSNDAGRPQE